MYDHTKRGIDVANLLSTTYSTRVKSRRWPLHSLAFILDTCRSNAKTILQYNGIRLTNFEMTHGLGKELVLRAIRRTYSQSNGLKITAINKIKRVFGINKVLARSQSENFNPTSCTCFKCVEAIVSKKSCKAEREKIS